MDFEKGFNSAYVSNDLIDDATPWVSELTPFIISPTTKLSFEETLNVVIFLSQLSTIPVAEFEVTVSPTA